MKKAIKFVQAMDTLFVIWMICEFFALVGYFVFDYHFKYLAYPLIFVWSLPSCLMYGWKWSKSFSENWTIEDHRVNENE